MVGVGDADGVADGVGDGSVPVAVGVGDGGVWVAVGVGVGVGGAVVVDVGVAVRVGVRLGVGVGDGGVMVAVGVAVAGVRSIRAILDSSDSFPDASLTRTANSVCPSPSGTVTAQFSAVPAVPGAGSPVSVSAYAHISPFI